MAVLSLDSMSFMDSTDEVDCQIPLVALVDKNNNNEMSTSSTIFHTWCKVFLEVLVSVLRTSVMLHEKIDCLCAKRMFIHPVLPQSNYWNIHDL